MALLGALRMAVAISLFVFCLQVSGSNDTESRDIQTSASDWSKRISAINKISKAAELKKPLSKSALVKLMRSGVQTNLPYQTSSSNSAGMSIGAEVNLETFKHAKPFVEAPHQHDENCDHKTEPVILQKSSSDVERAQIRLSRKPQSLLKQKALAQSHGVIQKYQEPSYPAADLIYNSDPAAAAAHKTFVPNENLNFKPNVKRVVVIRKPATKDDIPKFPPPPNFDFYHPSHTSAETQYSKESSSVEEDTPLSSAPAKDYTQQSPAQEYRQPAPQTYKAYRPPAEPNSYEDPSDTRFKEIRDEVSAEYVRPPSRRVEDEFQAPKFDLAKAAGSLNEKGCKMVIKEVQQVPSDQLHSKASDLRSIFRNKRSTPEGRRLTSIVMTKECYFPDAPAAGSSSVPFFQSGDYFGEKKEASRRSQYQKSNVDDFDKGYASTFPSDPFWTESDEKHVSYPQKSRSYDPPRYASQKQRTYNDDYNAGPKQGYHQTSTNNQGGNAGYVDDGYNARPKQAYHQSSTTNHGGNAGYGDYNVKPRQNYHHTRTNNYGNDRGYDTKPRSYQGDNNNNYGVRQSSTNHGHDRRPTNNYNSGEQYGGGYNGPPAGFYGGNQRNRESSPRGYGSESYGSGHGATPTPKMYSRSFEYYKRDNDKKKKDPNNFAEEYASGSYGSYASDYDSERDGKKKNRNQS